MKNFIKQLFQKPSKPTIDKHPPTGVSIVYHENTQELKITCSCKNNEENILAEILFKLNNGLLTDDLQETIKHLPNQIAGANILGHWQLLSQTQALMQNQPVISPTDVFNNEK